MSVQSIVWVIEDCPDLPKHLVATLVGLANHANENGRGAYPSQELLAWYTRKDERSVRRDLDQLEELKLIRKGDQRMVLHLPADKRPVVWDLAMERKRAPRPERGKPGRPRKEQKENEGTSAPTGNKSGHPENRGDADVRADADVKNGGTSTSKPQDADVPQTVLEPSREPSVPSERPAMDSKDSEPINKTVQSALIGEDKNLAPREPSHRDVAMGIARGWVGKWRDAELPMIMSGKRSDPMHAVANAITQALELGCTETEVKFALMYVNDLVPHSSPLTRALAKVKGGWRPGPNWKIGETSPQQSDRNGTGRANGQRNATGPMAGTNLFISDITPEQRAAQNPFAQAVRSSDVRKEATA